MPKEMYYRKDEETALSHIASRWWGGPDEGKEVEVTLEFKKPTDRSKAEVADLFLKLLDSLSGGYHVMVTVND